MPSAADVELRDGEDLVVRGWRDGDTEAVAATPRDPVIGDFFGMPVSGVLQTPDPTNDWFAVVEYGTPLGRIWRHGDELGYLLRKDAWGRGLATRSLRLVAGWLGSATVCIHPRNERSLAVARRAGFRPDGAVEEYARFGDGTTRALRFVWT